MAPMYKPLAAAIAYAMLVVLAVVAGMELILNLIFGNRHE